MSFEPKIIAIVCNWCAPSDLDDGKEEPPGTPPNIEIIRVMCCGRIDPTVVLLAFERGADGILICGCPPEDCHYAEGSLQTAKRIALLKKMLPQFGIEEDRVRLTWISPAERNLFSVVLEEMNQQIKALEPLKCSGGGGHV